MSDGTKDERLPDGDVTVETWICKPCNFLCDSRAELNAHLAERHPELPQIAPGEWGSHG